MEWSKHNGGVWVFGYGSLVWNPGFEYRKSLIGYIQGYERRFWQGNTTHRGTPEQPGRVATLVKNKQSSTWGRAFLLTESSAANSLSYLQDRETNLGGYITTIVDFQPRDKREGPGYGDSIPVIIYTATEHNPFYLGPQSTSSLVEQIANASGMSGPNAEYVFKLAEFMRREVPDIYDEHLFTLEKQLLERLDNLPEEDAELDVDSSPKKLGLEQEEDRLLTTVAFSTQVKARQLKCINIL